MDRNSLHDLRLPAEWEPQDGILLAWPHTGTDWQPLLDEVEDVYLEIVRQVSRFERVIIISPEAGPLEEKLRAAGYHPPTVQVLDITTNDTWIRDYGPVTVYRGSRPLCHDFVFNGWGGKYPAEQDNQVTRALGRQSLFTQATFITSKLVLEGGSIDCDGQGSLLTTSSCLLHPSRNPHCDQQDLNEQFAALFGCDHPLWLTHGWLSGDDTDGHIDMLARLCPGETILYCHCDDSEDPHYPELQKMAEELRNLTTRTGRSFRLLPLPWPAPHFWEGERLPASYANFLIINNAVLVPTYADNADGMALEIIGRAFPEREIIGIDSRPLIKQRGALHCMAMHLPRGVLT